MKFRLIVDNTKEEEIVATVHAPSGFTQELEMLALSHSGSDRLQAYMHDDMVLLSFSDIECITVLGGKTYAIDQNGTHYQLKQRLYEIEKLLPTYFIRINKSALANEHRLDRFAATFSGSVDAVFKCGYRDYVSRRCLSDIKRRYSK